MKPNVVIGLVLGSIILIGCAVFVTALFPEAPLGARIAAMLGLSAALNFAGPWMLYLVKHED